MLLEKFRMLGFNMNESFADRLERLAQGAEHFAKESVRQLFSSLSFSFAFQF